MSLAQRIIDCDLAIPGFPAIERERVRAVAMLAPPWDGNHVVPAHVALARHAAAEAAGVAERFVLHDDVLCSAVSVLADNESAQIALVHARLPASPLWFEWGGGWFGKPGGMLIDGDDRDFAWVYFDGCREQPPTPLVKGRWSFRDSDWGEFEYLDGAPVSDGTAEMADYIRIILAVCAFLNIPGAVRYERHACKDRLQRKRSQLGRAPLLSMNHVMHPLPKGAGSRHDKATTMSPGVRRHRVIGYLRISRNGDPEAHFIWVPAYWRGDPALGVVLKEREVSVRAA